ncbi:MAG TPA: hypothetical protein PK177_12840 [Burkholderiaceae bacterium]|nr:hypothetical protein [Burkholderiaceae bacterium]
MTMISAALRPWLCLLLAGSAALPVAPPSSAAARSPGPVPAPLQPRSEPISLMIAGQPAVLRVVRSNLAPGPTLAAVETIWRLAGDRVRRDEDAAWLSVSRIDSQGIEAVQLRAGSEGGSDGYLVRWTLNRSGAALAGTRDSLAHRLLPETAVVLSDTGSRQPGASGRTLVAWMPGSVDTAERLVLGRAETIGLQRRNPGGQDSRDFDRTQFYGSAGAEVALSLHSEGSGTALVIHLMETTR